MVRNLSKAARLRVAALALIAAGALAASALAVVNGQADGTQHPYVGMAVWFPTGSPAGGFELCSGSLVSATVFVTAAHCFPDGAAPVWVDMQEHALADLHQPHLGSAVHGTVTVDPYWGGGKGLAHSDLNDIAVVQLAAPIEQDHYASLPPRVGYDDTLPNNQAVEIVGYGIQTQTPPTFGSRFDAPAKIIPGGGATGADFLKISSSPGQGGATCNGDSGGPDLEAGTDVMLAISSYGPSATCNAVAYSQRMDTLKALSFVHSFPR